MPTIVRAALLLVSLCIAPSLARAQHEYYDTDAGRPLLVEDATPVERHAFELLLAPLVLERGDDGTYIWRVAPEITYGVLPRTHVELGAALAWSDPGAVGTNGGLAGLEFSVLHQLQIERRHVPAFAVAAHLIAPVGGMAHDDWLASFRAIATRTHPIARIHLNAEYTFGPSAGATGVHEASRWMAGVSVDRALPLRSTLLALELTAAQPIGPRAAHTNQAPPSGATRDVAWRLGGGIRHQLTPRLTMDVGVARTMTGHRAWHLTAGLARSFAVRRLIRVPDRARPAPSGWPIVHEQFYLPASHNWAFRDRHAVADRMFNAFDYGHAILYETLYTRRARAASLLEHDEYARIVGRILPTPPHVPLAESAIEIEYAKLVPEVKAMFEWAHILHRQIYDVWADERIPVREKDARVAELLRYYRSRRDVAFSTVPKNMDLMEGRPYSLAFRREFPKFNGLIWAYHWLQVGLYDAMIAAQTPAARQANVGAAVARFWQMLEHPPEHLPRLMPMTPAVAPLFTDRYPEAAAIFDNLHGLHDVVSDILASALVPRAGKRAAILEAAASYRDDTSYAMTLDEWREMARVMGVHNMGGPTTGFTRELPTPTVPIGASHHQAMGHDQPPASRPVDPHAGHEQTPPQRP